jgi:hypothetical protein
MIDPLLDQWLGGSLVRDIQGAPIVAWRGEHGAHDGRDFQTRHGSLSFGDRDTACIYATDPNDQADVVVAPRVSAWYLRIRRPVMNEPSDPFMDLPLLIDAIGRARTTELALRLSSGIMATNNWEDNFAPEWGCDVAGLLRSRPASLDELYLPAYQIMDDAEACGMLARAGYDGAICCGMGENALETEWRVIDPSDALPAWCWRTALLERETRMAA